MTAAIGRHFENIKSQYRIPLNLSFTTPFWMTSFSRVGYFDHTLGCLQNWHANVAIGRTPNARLGGRVKSDTQASHNASDKHVGHVRGHVEHVQVAMFLLSWDALAARHYKKVEPGKPQITYDLMKVFAVHLIWSRAFVFHLCVTLFFLSYGSLACHQFLRLPTRLGTMYQL